MFPLQRCNSCIDGSGVERNARDWKGWIVATPGLECSARNAARSALVDTVFNSTAAIASGGISCLMIGLATAWRSGGCVAIFWALAFMGVTIGRLMLSSAYLRSGRTEHNKERWARSYAVGALLSAVILGTAAGVAIALDLPTALLVGLAAIGSAGGIAGRNSALPRLAMAQCTLLIVPTAFAGFWSAEPANVMLAPTAIAYGTALFSFIRNYYRERAALIVAQLDDAALARHDVLTGVPNRRSFDERLASLWATGGTRPAPLALLLIDIDHFKRYNDLYGHPAGDDCLRHIVWALRDLLGENEMIARYGGEEFVVLLPGCTLEQALVLANRMCRAIVDLGIEQAMRTDDLDVVTISVGIGVSSAAVSAQHLVEVADRALYRAKRGGRNRVYPESAQTVVALQRGRPESKAGPTSMSA
jgi:diguanylate cyclase (GGDEF)-like protein